MQFERNTACSGRQKAKVFNVTDEFLVHVFKAHLSASVCTLLKVQSTSDVISHEPTERWLRETAETLLADTLMPVQASDPVYAFHRSLLHLGFLYYDLRNAIRWEDGPQIIQHWVLWLPCFLATGRNYASEAVNLIANLKADFPLSSHSQQDSQYRGKGREGEAH